MRRDVPLSVSYSFTVLASLALAWTAYAQSPVTITLIGNALGYQSQLAPDTVFVIFGSGMGPATIATANAPSYPTSLAGTSVTFTPAAGGDAIAAKMIYSLAGQIAGLLPSSIAPGTYSASVTYNGLTSAPQNVTVVARSLGIATADSSGSGNVQATIGNINGGISLTRFTSGSVSFGGNNWVLSPAHPGDTLVFWGTGGGADPANDAGGTSGDQTAAGNFIVIVNGRQITPLYSGASSGYPGLFQVNFTLPLDIATRCFNYVQISAGGVLSNAVNLPIAAAGQNTCPDPTLTPSFLTQLDAGSTGGTINIGTFAIAKSTSISASTSVTSETASGFFGRYTIAAYLLPQIGPKIDNCSVYDRTFPVGGTDPGSPSLEMDAGAQLPLTGQNLPAGFALGVTPISLGSFYSHSPTNGTLTGGATYSLSGSGGTQVGSFPATSTIFPTAFTATNFNSITSIDRTRPVTFNWTGSGLQTVTIQFNTNVRTGTTQRIVTLSCVVPANLGTYTVPPQALAYLQTAGTVGVGIGGQSPAGFFTAPLLPSGQLDLGVFLADLLIATSVPIQ